MSTVSAPNFYVVDISNESMRFVNSLSDAQDDYDMLQEQMEIMKLESMMGPPHSEICKSPNCNFKDIDTSQLFDLAGIDETLARATLIRETVFNPERMIAVYQDIITSWSLSSDVVCDCGQYHVVLIADHYRVTHVIMLDDFTVVGAASYALRTSPVSQRTDKAGSFILAVAKEHRNKGLGTILMILMLRRFTVDLGGQFYTPMGMKFIRSFIVRNRQPLVNDQAAALLPAFAINYYRNEWDAILASEGIKPLIMPKVRRSKKGKRK